MRFTLKNPRSLQYIDYQNVRKTEFLGCQSQEIFGYAPTPLFVECLFRNHVCAAGGIGVDKSKPHQLQAPLH